MGKASATLKAGFVVQKSKNNKLTMSGFDPEKSEKMFKSKNIRN